MRHYSGRLAMITVTFKSFDLIKSVILPCFSDPEDHGLCADTANVLEQVRQVNEDFNSSLILVS